jgi:hypothetical protein
MLGERYRSLALGHAIDWHIRRRSHVALEGTAAT